MKRTRLRAMSSKQRKLNAAKEPIRRAVFERDGYRCQLNGVEGAWLCFGDLTAHHIVKASQGGTYSLDNLATLCAHHNSELESDADLAALAVSLGLVVRRAA